MSNALKTPFVGILDLRATSLSQCISDSSNVLEEGKIPTQSDERALQFYGARSIISLTTRRFGISGRVGKNPETGQPIWTGTHPLHLSISHCQGWAAAAISWFPIGIDLEPSDRQIAPKAVQRIYGENEEMPSPEPGLPPQLVRWTAKEAACKAFGVGLSHSNLIQIQWTKNREGRFSVDGGDSLSGRLDAPEISVSSHRGLVLSVCSPRKGFSPEPAVQFT